MHEVASNTARETDNDIPLFVDLDGTLIKTDLLFESFFALLKNSLLSVFLIPVWLLKGRSYLKRRIASNVDLDFESLPYHEAFLRYLIKEKTAGRRLILTTASDAKYAEQVAAHLNIFEEVHASDGDRNMKGYVKLQRMRSEFGDYGFDYAGNSKADLEIWRYARHTILVNAEPGVERSARKLGHIEHVFDDRSGGIREYLRAMRPQQWLKNILLFVPLAASHQVLDPQLMLQVVVAFLAFALCASSVYLLNDLLDLTADRHHARKKNRPFASGSASIKYGTFIIPALLAAAFGLASFLPTYFIYALCLYYVLTLAYSLYLKSKLIVDVLLLAALYTIRIIAGAAAIQSVPSFWLLAFAMFLFLSLALIKRYSELLELQASNKNKAKGRGYLVNDLVQINILGVASGYQAVLVLALYINSPVVEKYYTHPQVIWLLCPVLLYWISRAWLIAGRGKMHDDPLIYAIKERASQYAAVSWIAITLAAS